MDPEIKNGNPVWLFLAIPVFLLGLIFGVWYAVIAGLGAFAILFVIFVWLPNDEARKLNRKAMFAKAKKLLHTIPSQLREVDDQEIVKECTKALLTIDGLIKAFESESKSQGRIEEKILPTLRNLSGMLTTWIGHESGEYPISEEKATKYRRILLHFDELILSFQSGSLNQAGSLAQLYETESDMLSAGINPEEGGN